MSYTLVGINLSINVELQERKILNIIRNGLNASLENGEITNAQSIVIKHLIELNKIRINFEELGEPIRINRNL